MSAEKTLVVCGAGNIGRGIVSVLFQQAGYRLLFYRRDAAALRQLKSAAHYPVFLLDRDGADESVEIDNFDVLLGEDALVEALTEHDLAAFCLGRAAFASAAGQLARACRLRKQRGRSTPCEILLCSNEPDGREALYSLLLSQLRQTGEEALAALAEIAQVLVYSVGYSSEDRAPFAITATANGTLEADADALSMPLPAVPNLLAGTNVQAKLYRKLYIANMFHTYAALLGAQKGTRTMAECYADPQILAHVQTAFAQSEAAVLRQWQFDAGEHAAWRAAMLEKMCQPSGDPLPRVLRDLPKKSGRRERFAGPILLCLRFGLPCGELLHALRLLLGTLQSDAGICALDPMQPQEAQLLRLLNEDNK